MNRFFTTFLVTVLMLAFHPAQAQKAHRSVGVTVTCTCDDATGQAYVSALHQALANSSRYREMSASEGFEKNAIRINIISMPLDPHEGRPQAALSIVCLHDGAILHQFVETCTHIPIEECAESMIHDLLQWEGQAA